MVQYVDPIPPLIKALKPYVDARVYGNTIPANAVLPVVLIKNAGGTDYTRVMLLARTESVIDSMNLCINALNSIIRNAAFIPGLRVFDIEKEIAPISSIDEDTGKPEAWCYLRVDHFEA